MKAGGLKTYLGFITLLLVFWLLITWDFHVQELVAGILVCVLVGTFCRDMLITEEERPKITIRNIFRFVRYMVFLIFSIIEANIDVAKIVLSPKMPITPTLVEFKVNLKKDLSKVIFANSITLTPGTLTIDLEDDVYLVHGLTRKHATNVIGWHMALKLMEMEED